MHLASLQLKNFRACRDTSVPFASDLTVLVGENASGKSAIIDALRLATYQVTGRQTAYFSADADLSRSVGAGTPVEISCRYGGLTELEHALYLPKLVDGHDDLVHNAIFATDPRIPRRSVTTWSVGEAGVEDPEPASRRRIAHVYLPPLRDALRDLDGHDQTQLFEVLRILVGGNALTEEAFVNDAATHLAAIANLGLAINARQQIQEYYSQAVPPSREHHIALNHRDKKLRHLASLLRIQLSEADLPEGDIATTGLGYASLLYISMIVLQLVKARESDLTLLLVEEPEAHLHPQLQLVLLDFLRNQAKTSGDDAGGRQPAGKVQVIVTTHSPTLASTVSIKNIVVVARDSEEQVWQTTCTALARLPLKPADFRKIDRYLSVTRAALLFARVVILVEGIAEMLLLPALAKHYLKTETIGEVDAEIQMMRRLRQFHSATFINVEGVDFEPYLDLLLSGGTSRIDKVVVVTDGDPTVENPAGAGADRRATYVAKYPDDASAGRLIVSVGGTTLEAEMFRYAENEDRLREAFLKLHPRSQENWDAMIAAVGAGDELVRANVFAQAIKPKKKRDHSKASDSSGTTPTTPPLIHLNIGKGDFSHVIAEALEMDLDTSSEMTMRIPDYLVDALAGATHIKAVATATTSGPTTSPTE